MYRLSLNDPRLTDQLFAQLVSPTGMKHDNAVLQISAEHKRVAVDGVWWRSKMERNGALQQENADGWCRAEPEWISR